MPRHPDTAGSVEKIQGSVFSSVAGVLADYPGELFRFQVGDTWMEPPEGCRMEDLTVAGHPGMHRYAPTRGLPGLVSAVAERVTGRSGLSTGPEEILISAGATGGLAAVLGTILEPDDEILILAPYWPLIDGLVRTYHGNPVPVPFIGDVTDPESAVAAVESRRTDRTVAVYLSTPNNPTGRLIPGEQLEALAEWARSNRLWLISDEVYEDYAFAGRHVYSRPLAPERTFSVHSFSKAFGMAGNRCGYVAGPAGVMDRLERISIHNYYSTPTASQLAAARALDGAGDRWVDRARSLYREAGASASRILGVPAPEGSTFLFLDVADCTAYHEAGLNGLMIELARNGVAVAPGPSFGPYPSHIRVCFTADPPDVMERGMEKLAGLLRRA
jgi:N-succinyldiaminopimelate aminotransferase